MIRAPSLTHRRRWLWGLAGCLPNLEKQKLKLTEGVSKGKGNATDTAEGEGELWVPSAVNKMFGDTHSSVLRSPRQLGEGGLLLCRWKPVAWPSPRGARPPSCPPRPPATPFDLLLLNLTSCY